MLTHKCTISIVVCLYLIGRQRIPRITRFSRFGWQTGIETKPLLFQSHNSFSFCNYLQGPPGHPGPDGPTGGKGVKVFRICKLHNFECYLLALLCRALEGLQVTKENKVVKEYQDLL